MQVLEPVKKDVSALDERLTKWQKKIMDELEILHDIPNQFAETFMLIESQLKEHGNQI